MLNLNPNNTDQFNRCIAIAYQRRAESVINDRSIDGRTRSLIRYALETCDPWLAELLRRVDAGESLEDTDFSQEPQPLQYGRRRGSRARSLFDGGQGVLGITQPLNFSSATFPK